MTLEQYLEKCRKKWDYTPDITLSQWAATFAMNQNNIIMHKVDIQPFHLIGIAVRTTNVNSQAAKDIQALWRQFLSEQILHKIPNKIDGTIYSLYTEYEGDHMKPYTAMIGCKVSELSKIPDGMVGKSFDGGTYVKFTARGDLQKGLIVNQWSKTWNMNLDRQYTADFEVFGEKAQHPNDAEVDFYVAVH